MMTHCRTKLDHLGGHCGREIENHPRLVDKQNKLKDKPVNPKPDFLLFIFPKRGVCGPIPAVVQNRANPWPGRGKPLFHGRPSKIRLIYLLLDEQHFRYYSEKNRYYT